MEMVYQPQSGTKSVKLERPSELYPNSTRESVIPPVHNTHLCIRRVGAGTL